MKDESYYIFVIKTNKYAGNFERDMTAYSTGTVGECGVGEEKAKEFLLQPHGQELVEEFDGILYHKPDDNGCHRPCSIWGEPKYNDVAIFFYTKPSKKLIDIIKERSEIYAKSEGIKIKGFNLLKEVTKIEREEVDE